MTLKRCFRQPIPEIFDVARYLDAAVSAHLKGEVGIASDLFLLANDNKVRDWLDSIWGKNSPYVSVKKLPVEEVTTKIEARMPTAAQVSALHVRDGFYCRFCGIPVIRAEVRKHLAKIYPSVITWGRTNLSQHAAFQALWAQYDHVVPHSCGGTNDLENLVVTCAACNFGKMSYRLEELGLIDPRVFAPVEGDWDGLERLLPENLRLTTPSSGLPKAALWVPSSLRLPAAAEVKR